jgi:hypothetical protein
MRGGGGAAVDGERTPEYGAPVPGHAAGLQLDCPPVGCSPWCV